MTCGTNGLTWLKLETEKRKKMVFKESMAKMAPNLLKNNHPFDLSYLNSKWNKCKENYICAHHSHIAAFSLEKMEAIIQ